jgi:hypothetical protein
MLQSPRYNFTDILAAPARALSARRILAMTVFLLFALLVYNAFTYLALTIAGERVGLIWDVYGLLPFVWFTFQSWLARIVFYAGIAVSGLSVMAGLFSVAIIEIEEIRGNRFLSARKAIALGLRRFGQLFSAELAIVLALVFLVGAGALLGLITRIPYLGEWIFAIFFVLPNFLVSMLAMLVVAVLAISVLLLPATAAAERHGQAFSAILETFSTIIRQPVRWVGYTAYALVSAKVFGFVYAYAAYRAIQFLVWTASIGGGSVPVDLVRSGLAHLPVRSQFAQFVFNVFPGIDWGFSISRRIATGGESASGYLMAAMLFVCFATIVAYMLSVVATAQARTYVALRFRKDNYAIDAEKPLFFTDEWVNPSPHDPEPPDPANPDRHDSPNKP